MDPLDEYTFVNDSGGVDEKIPLQPPLPPLAPAKKRKIKHPKIQQLQQQPSNVSYKNIIVHLILTVMLAVYVTDIYMVLSYKYTHQYGEKIIYPLMNGTYDTTTTTMTAIDKLAIPLETILHQLRLNLIARPHCIILCMHHLKLPSDSFPYYPICTLYNRQRSEFIDMIEPHLIGSSSSTRYYTEKSVSCTQTHTRERFEQIIVAWTSPQNRSLYSLFNVDDSVALQLALNEFKGNKHCH